MFEWKKCECKQKRSHVNLFGDMGRVSQGGIFNVADGDEFLDAGVRSGHLDVTEAAKLKEDLRTFGLPATPRDEPRPTEDELKTIAQNLAGLPEAEIKQTLDAAVNEGRVTQEDSERIQELIKTVEPTEPEPTEVEELLQMFRAMGINVADIRNN